jgi:tripartite-type tricarboxylate transporter receptor subunit TctC
VIKAVPTTREVGNPIDMTIWHGLYAPKGTPEDALSKLHAALQTALNDKTINDRFAEFGTSAFPAAQKTRAAHKTAFATEVTKWQAALKAAGIQPQN